MGYTFYENERVEGVVLQTTSLALDEVLEDVVEGEENVDSEADYCKYV